MAASAFVRFILSPVPKVSDCSGPPDPLKVSDDSRCRHPPIPAFAALLPSAVHLTARTQVSPVFRPETKDRRSFRGGVEHLQPAPIPPPLQGAGQVFRIHGEGDLHAAAEEPKRGQQFIGCG
jgi:hypothetical protein